MTKRRFGKMTAREVQAIVARDAPGWRVLTAKEVAALGITHCSPEELAALGIAPGQAFGTGASALSEGGLTVSQTATDEPMNVYEARFAGAVAAGWPKVGDTVCDCRYEHVTVTEKDGDDVRLSNGNSCSIKHCLDLLDHPWADPVNAV